MSESTLTIKYKVSKDGKGWEPVKEDLEAYNKVMASTVEQVQKLNTRAVNFAAISANISGAKDALAGLNNFIDSVTASSRNLEVANVKLATVMEQRMGATAEDVAGIKSLISAQKEAGIIATGVQLAGAQQVATFLEQKESIETLLPAMNNLLAQQKDFGATNEDAVGIANLMGKAMQGNVSALKRVGITFTEAEAEAMKYGDESERAAMLAQIITNNVGDMNTELAKTSAGKLQKIDQYFGGLKKKIGENFWWAAPFTKMAVGAAETLTVFVRLRVGILSVTNFVGKFGIQAKIATVWTKLLAVAKMGLAGAGRILSTALQFVTAGATTAAVAIRGLLVATGVGAVIAALAYGVYKLIEAFNGTKDAADEAGQGIDETKERAERASKAFSDTNSETFSRLMGKYKELQAQWKTLSDEHSKARWIKNNQSALSELGAEIRNTKEAENYFNKNTDAVVAAFQARAKAAANLAKLTELYRQQLELTDQIDTENEQSKIKMSKIKDKKAGDVIHDSDNYGYDNWWRKQHINDGSYTARLVNDPKAPGGQRVEMQLTDKGAKSYNESKKKAGVFSSGYAGKKAELQGINSQIDKTSANVASSAKEAEEAQKRANAGVKGGSTGDKKGNGGSGGKNDADVLRANAKSYADLSHNLSVYKKRLEATNPADTQKVEDLRVLVKTTEEASNSTKNLIDGINTADPRTIEDYERAISAVQDKMKRATADSIAGLRAEEEELQKRKKTLEKAGYAPPPIETIKTYEELNRAVSYYEEELKTANSTARLTIQEQINKLDELKDAWDKQRKGLKTPAGIEQLHTARQLGEALNYYRDKQQDASGDEVDNIERTIEALERKENALKRGAELRASQKEIDEINGLSGREYKIKVRGFGFDELTAKIKALNKLLQDQENPVSDSQRAQIEQQIQAYEKWRKEGVQSFETFTQGWNEIKNVAGGINSITDALKGNTDAWSVITGVIDGAIQIYQGIQGIISIISMLTAVTTGKNTAETVGATATITNVTAQSAQLALAPAQIAANKALTASVMEYAAAQYMAAHAAIPFAGFGIGAGFVAAAQSAVLTAGAIPFANGGIVSGPTFALVGEYAGASNNPEVIAPLDKLRSMIEPSGGIGGNVRFEIEGRKLVGVISNETRIGSKSGKRTGIKI